MEFFQVSQICDVIDKAISKTFCQLNGKEATVLANFHDVLRKTFERHSKVTHLKKIVNWSDLCETRKLPMSAPAMLHYRYCLFNQQ